MKRITDWVHDGLQTHLQPGDWAIDATLGNGHDAKVLLGAVGAEGKVFAFDTESDAIASARQTFADDARLIPFLRSHDEFDQCLPPAARGRLRAVVFNLGYLPGGDHGSPTEAATTLPALALALDWLAPGGVLCCTPYPGTDAGLAEALAIDEWTAGLAGTAGHLTRIESLGTRSRGPYTLWLEKR